MDKCICGRKYTLLCPSKITDVAYIDKDGFVMKNDIDDLDIFISRWYSKCVIYVACKECLYLCVGCFKKSLDFGCLFMYPICLYNKCIVGTFNTDNCINCTLPPK